MPAAHHGDRRFGGSEHANAVIARRECRDNGIVATWHEFESGAPQMAAVAAMLWPGITALGRGQPAPPGTPCFPVAFLATARPDGSPRLHPFCPVLAGGRLLAAIPRSSPKGNDLRRCPWAPKHAVPQWLGSAESYGGRRLGSVASHQRPSPNPITYLPRD